jgi:hypothetical protein
MVRTSIKPAALAAALTGGTPPSGAALTGAAELTAPATAAALTRRFIL